MKQIALFGGTQPVQESKYSTKIQAPIYEPKNSKPFIGELCNMEKTKRLIAEIEAADIPSEEKAFLIEAARRHSVFNYEKIADYYSHSSPQLQHLMERSALVIIDFDKAIKFGYIKLCDDIRGLYMEDQDCED